MDLMTVLMLAVLAVLVFMMFRNSRKRQKDQAELQQKMVPGAEVMTTFGLYGTLVSVDEESNIAEVAVSEGTVVRVHRQTLAKVVDDQPLASETESDGETKPAAE